MSSYQFRFIHVAALALPFCWISTSYGTEANLEDLPIEDAPPSASTPTTSTPSTSTQTVQSNDANPPNIVVDNTPFTITKSQWEAFLVRQKQLEDEIAALKGQVNKVPGTATTTEQPPSLDNGGKSTPRPASGNRSLLLPDISFIATGKFNATNDRRDEDRNRFFLDEGEIGIQGYVYPGVKAEASMVAAPGEDEPFNIEEANLTFLGLRKNLNLVVGRKFAPFGRTGEQHPHSWMYSRQLIPRSNLIAGEALAGDGLLARLLLPTGKNFYANLDLGLWNAAENEEGVILNAPDQLIGGPGASFVNRFYTARLYASKAIGRNNELEAGASWARGESALVNDNTGASASGKAQITGLDLTWRRFFSGPKRLLLRGEYFHYKPGGGLTALAHKASGYYGLANYRLNKRDDVGLLFERSGFPGNDGHESAASVIFTRQFTEQFYLRLHATRGNRPGGDYNQAIMQLTWGIGPHTHSLE